MTPTSPPSKAVALADNERFLFDEASKAYFKAGETSDPQHWLEAALLAQQHRNALVALRAATTAVGAGEGVRDVANWMILHSYATGHGDTLEDLLSELVAQARPPVSGDGRK